MADSLFTPETTEVPALALNDLVGDGKKYADGDKLANAYAHAETHIQRLTRELEDVRKAASEGLTYQQFIDKMDARLKATPQTPATNPDESARPNPQPTNPPNVEELISKALDTRDTRGKEQGNLQFVASVLERNFGPGFAQVLLEKGKALGIGQQTMDELARKQPQALLKLVDAKVEVQPDRTPAPAARANPGVARGANVKNATYFDNIRKTDPRYYFSVKGIQDRLAAIREMGEESFYS